MEYQKFFKELKELYSILYNYIEGSDQYENEEDYTDLIDFYLSQIYIPHGEKLKSFLYLINQFTMHHYRKPQIFRKIEKVILSLEKEIKQTFTNVELFKLFQSNKSILLILFTHNIIFVDTDIIFQNNEDASYWRFFYPEKRKHFIQKVPQELLDMEPKDMDEYERKRQIGENDSYICFLIRNDSIDEFVAHVNQTNLSLSKTIIGDSIFETNPFLIGKNPTLIEYAAFFGSIQIFNYLRMNKVELTPSLWLYSIHSNCAELINLLEENHVPLQHNSYYACLEEAIKCHHNEIASYIINNFIDPENHKKFYDNVYNYAFCYDNYEYLPDDEKNEFILGYACRYNYIQLVEFFLSQGRIDINQKIYNILKKKIIYNNTTLINLAARGDNQEILSLLLSQDDIELGPNCFSDCIKLSKINIPPTVKKIGDYAFSGCSSLKEIEIPSSVKTIGLKAISDCDNLSKLIIHPSVTSSADCIITSCPSLKQITIPTSLLSCEIDKSSQVLNNDEYDIEELTTTEKKDLLVKSPRKRIYKITNKKNGKVQVVKRIATSLIHDLNKFRRELNIFIQHDQYGHLPGLLKINDFHFPLFKKESLNKSLDEINIIDENGKIILTDFPSFSIFTDFMKYGNLEQITKEYLESNGKKNDIMNPTVRSKIIFGVAAIMNIFHKNSKLFVGLTNSNVLLDDNLEPRIGYHESFTNNFDFIASNEIPIDHLFYIAPELIEYEYFSYQVDVYSFAFFVYKMFSTTFDIKHEHIRSKARLLIKIMAGMRPARPKNIPDIYWELIECCWSNIADNRPTFSDIVEVLKDDKFALNEFGMSTDLKELHEYQERF